MSIRPSVRFDVFKRDSFTCAYCGRRSPDVTLEVDHIIPVAEGGSDDPENLITACWDCNRGKGTTPLEVEPQAIPDLEERAELVRERERQLRIYHEAKAEEATRRKEQLAVVYEHWFTAAEVDEMPRGCMPYTSTLRKYIDLLGPDEVMDAMQIAWDHADGWIKPSTARYFVGVLKHKHAEAEDRIANCNICGKRLILKPGDDSAAGWAHQGCIDDGDAI